MVFFLFISLIRKFSNLSKKDGIVFRKGKLTGKILGEWEVQEEAYAMNLHCIHRF